MTDLHLKALANSSEAIRRGECYAQLDSCSAAGEAFMRTLRSKHKIRTGPVYLPSQEALATADASGLSVRFN